MVMEYFSARKGNTGTCYNMNELCKHYATWKKPVTKGYVKYDSIYVKSPEQLTLYWQKAD